MQRSKQTVAVPLCSNSENKLMQVKKVLERAIVHAFLFNTVTHFLSKLAQ